MRRLLKSQDYLMKCLGFLLLLGFISLGAIGGCNNNGGKGDGTRVLTEHDFGQDEGLRADPEKHLIVKFLEHPEHDAHENDTGGIGHDVIPHAYTRTVNHTFCWEDEDPDAEHFMVIEDSKGNEIVRLHAGDCVTETIFEGDYEMKLHHDGKIERNHPIFIKHGQDGDQAAKKDEIIPKGILARAEKVISRILEKLDIGITQTTNAQTLEDNINTLLLTNACSGCNLGHANLSTADLRFANLSGADLNFAILFSADLSSANLTGAYLSNAVLRSANLDLADFSYAVLSSADLSSAISSDADFSYADFSYADLSFADLSGAILLSAFMSSADLLFADLSGADLHGANMSGANLRFADLSGADLNHADLSGADLSDTNLNFVDLSGADLSDALWCDGLCNCADPSIGTCVGCAPQSSCMGL